MKKLVFHITKMRLVSRPNFKGNEVFNNKNYGEYTVYVSGPATYAVPLFYEKTSFHITKRHLVMRA